uniref:Saposin A-type domain-containing protein n=1 Tax=Bursaphelenchus xylophilus TaxID=6326 RepID=A0A1I7RWD2_BURXY
MLPNLQTYIAADREMLLFLIFLGLTPLTNSFSLDCTKIPPALWCLNETLSKECKWDQQCNDYLASSKGQKILLTVLYETLCPDCSWFIKGPLYKLYSEHRDKVDIELVPFGKAKIDEQGHVTCQHLEAECNGNRYEACLIHYLSDPFPFIKCAEEKLEQKEDINEAAEACYKELGTPSSVVDEVNQCYNGELGNELIKKNQARTYGHDLVELTSVPWILINNVSLDGIQTFQEDISAAINGWYVPA